jgi:hypothetical protein
MGEHLPGVGAVDVRREDEETARAGLGGTTREVDRIGRPSGGHGRNDERTGAHGARHLLD